MKKILVPTDFSPNAAKAIDYAVQIAKRNQATIYLVHAVDLMDTTFQDRLEVKEEYNKTISDEAFKQLDMIRKSIEDTEQVLVNTQLFNGLITDTILVAARDHGVDLIIMGTMGRSGLKEVLFGSKTAAIIGRSTIPVLAIPLEYEWSIPKEFILAVNHFEESTDLYDPVFDLARVFNAEVEIAVYTPEEDTVPIEYVEHEKEIHRLEETLKSKYAGVTIHPEHLAGDRFTDTLNKHIREKNIDLLAMTTHRRGMIEGVFNRSMTRRMAYHAKVPLLAIPTE